MRKLAGEVARFMVDGHPTYVICWDDQDQMYVIERQLRPGCRFRQLTQVHRLDQAWRQVSLAIDQRLDPGARTRLLLRKPQ